MILAKESNNSKEIHAELTESMLHMLGDEKPFFKNLNDYYVVREMCNQIHGNLLGKTENTSRLMARFQKCNDSVRKPFKKKQNRMLGLSVVYAVEFKPGFELNES